MSSIQNSIGGLASVGFGLLANAAVQAGGHVFELTKKLHISAEGLTALHFAADQLESSAGAVDGALSKMAVTLGKAVIGSREARVAFRSIGLDWQKLSKIPVEQQFLEVIAALNKIPNTAKRAAAGQAIFGKGSKELAALIAAGTDAIIEQSQRAADLGAVMSTEVAQSLDDAGDSVAALRAQWSALRNEVVSMFSGETAQGLLAFGTGIIRVFKFVGYSIRGVLLEIFLDATRVVKGIAGLFNLVLPKAMEIDVQPAEQLIDSLRLERNKQFTNAGNVFTPAENPLKPPTNDAAVAKNTGEIRDSMDRLNATMTELVAIQRAQREGTAMPPPEIFAAGVR